MKQILLPVLLSLIFSQSIADSASTTIVAGSAKVNSTCTVSVFPIDFGTIKSNSQNQQSTILTSTCTKGTAFNVSLSSGNSGDFSNRYMFLNGNSDQLRYNIYFDTLYNAVVGDGTNGTVTINDIGSGIEQNYTLFGKIPTGQYVSPGIYTDLITATLSY